MSSQLPLFYKWDLDDLVRIDIRLPDSFELHYDMDDDKEFHCKCKMVHNLVVVNLDNLQRLLSQYLPKSEVEQIMIEAKASQPQNI